MTAPAPRRPEAGFTLLEALVTVAILALIAGAAAAGWHQQFIRGWRVQTRADMMAAMLELQQLAGATGGYADDSGKQPAGRWPRWVPPPPARAHHRIVATSCAVDDLNRCVQLRAVPQQADPACGTLVLRSTGEWLSEPEAGADPVPLPDGC